MNYKSINGEIKEFKVTCFKCKKDFTLITREKKFLNKTKFYCSLSCANIREHSDGTRCKIKKSMSGRHLAEDHKQKISAGNKGGRCSWYDITKPNGQIIKVQGSYEKRFANYLNNIDSDWIKPTIWNREHQFQWFDEKENSHWYTPDFWSPKFQQYYEIKGFWKKGDEIKRKFIESIDNIKILYIKDLKELNI